MSKNWKDLPNDKESVMNYLKEFVKEYDITDVYITGSRIFHYREDIQPTGGYWRKAPHEKSDWDVLVITDKPKLEVVRAARNQDKACLDVRGCYTKDEFEEFKDHWLNRIKAFNINHEVGL